MSVTVFSLGLILIRIRTRIWLMQQYMIIIPMSIPTSLCNQLELMCFEMLKTD
jgi:hypothetical protein